jgi:hypothetical protein
VRRLQHVRQARRRVPADQRIDRRRERIEIAPDPAEPLRVVRIGGRPDVGAGEVRAALVLVAGPLDQGQLALVENLLQASEPRMESERHLRRIGPDLQHLPGGHGDRRTPRVVVRIVVRDQHAQRVVAAAHVEDDEVPRVHALRARQIAEKLRRREGHRERGDAAFDELPPGDFHTS